MSETEKLRAAIKALEKEISDGDSNAKAGGYGCSATIKNGVAVSTQPHPCWEDKRPKLVLYLAALREKLERMCPKPLTVEELKARKNHSVWVKFKETGFVMEVLVCNCCFNMWALVDSKGGFWPLNGQVNMIFYATEPEGERT